MNLQFLLLLNYQIKFRNPDPFSILEVWIRRNPLEAPVAG